MNNVILYGNLTRSPELKVLPNGTMVCNISIATNRRIKQGDEWVDVADFHNVVVFGKRAEVVSKYTQKGSRVLIQGRLQTRKWESKEGETRYKTEIIAEDVQLSPKNSGPATQDETTLSEPIETI